MNLHVPKYGNIVLFYYSFLLILIPNFECRDIIVLVYLLIQAPYCFVMPFGYNFFLLTFSQGIPTLCAHSFIYFCGPLWSTGSALNSVEGQVIDTALGKLLQKFHLISPSCPRPNSVFTVQNSGLKHWHFIFFSGLVSWLFWGPFSGDSSA